MWRWIGAICVGGCALIGSAAARALFQPTPPPSITAEAADWYHDREPIVHAGNTYHRAGAPVFFDGYVMVRTGWYRGVPLYADTTLEPFSIVLVPIGGRWLQPYERRREGELVGTVGSRAPSFPIERDIEAAVGTTGTTRPTGIMAPGPPVGPNPDVYERPAPAEPSARPAPAGREPRIRMQPQAPARRSAAQFSSAVSSGVVSINYEGRRWRLAGRAVALQGDRYVQVGEYHGFPVYALRHAPPAAGGGSITDRIFIVSTSGGFLTPYVRIP